MLKIRDFAWLGEVSMATLRYYDEIGLKAHTVKSSRYCLHLHSLRQNHHRQNLR
jgi:DNA-binding transcriptional MerR regulator